MLIYLILPVVLVIAAQAAARIYIRRTAANKSTRPEERMRVLQRWAEHPASPVRTEARILWAESLRASNHAGALEVLQPVLEKRSRAAVPALVLAGRWAMHDGWPEHAEKHYSQAVQRLRKRGDRLLRGRIHRLRAESALHSKNTARAFESLDAAVFDSPFDAETRLLRAAIRFHEGRPAEAVEDYDFLEKHFGNAALRVRVAVSATVVELLLGKTEQALGRIDALLSTGIDGAAPLRSRRAVLLALNGRPDDAERELTVLNDDRRRPFVLGCIALARKDWDESQRRFSEHLLGVPVNDPSSAEAMWLLMRALRASGRDDQAASIAERIRALWPASPYLQDAPAPGVLVH